MSHFAWKIRLAKFALYWEACWRALVPVLCIIGAFAALALAGVLETVPRSVHIGLLAVFFLAIGWFGRGLFNLTVPSDAHALRRLEKASGIDHRPASAFFDELGTDPADQKSLRLWAAHKQRMAKLLSKLKPDWPAPNVARIDPYAVRAALVLALGSAFFLAGPAWKSRLYNAVLPAQRTFEPVWVEAWISPPPYTQRAPIFLIGKNQPDRFANDSAIEVPEGSRLVVRLSKTDAPRFAVTDSANPVENQKPQLVKFSTLSDKSREAKLTLKQSGQVQIHADGRKLAHWRISVIPDKTPVVTIIEPVTSTTHKALQFEVELGDDYGIIAADTHFNRTGTAAEQRKPVAPLQVKPPDFVIALPKTRVSALKHKIFRDLTAHPWAGLKVRMHITARDEAGKTGRSKPILFTLPARRFSKPLARAIIEQRQKLVFDTNDRFKVATALHALTIMPEGLIKDTGVYLALRTMYYRLSRAYVESDFNEVVDLLWETALRVEDGDLSFAERALREAQEALMRALANGAPPDEISKLMAQLRQALNRYLQALAQQARRQAGNLQRMPNGARMLRPQDLNRMLDMLENLARTGSRDAAQQLLAQLRALLENLRAGARGGQQRQQSGLSKMLNGLSGLIGKQQQLMDKTFKQRRGPNGLQGDALAGNQDALARTLEELQRQLGRMGAKPPSALDRAGRSMRGAAGALREGNGSRAVNRQGRALDQLRQGAQALAQEMMNRMTRGRNGNGPRGRNLSDRRDPLGRPMRTTGPDFGNATKVPTEFEVQRARQIMRELQQRLGDRARPVLELDYIERLLRRF